MAKGMLHFTRAGAPYAGAVHKMSSGSILTGATHSLGSEQVYHFKDLSAASKNRAGQAMAVRLAKVK